MKACPLSMSLNFCTLQEIICRHAHVSKSQVHIIHCKGIDMWSPW
uniref:Uncharacterized protein n=1 Tax=Anguilla anguilla TaxID=7936 RepID=A0A0E9TVF3_ANGAN